MAQQLEHIQDFSLEVLETAIKVQLHEDEDLQANLVINVAEDLSPAMRYYIIRTLFPTLTKEERDKAIVFLGHANDKLDG